MKLNGVRSGHDFSAKVLEQDIGGGGSGELDHHVSGHIRHQKLSCCDEIFQLNKFISKMF